MWLAISGFMVIELVSGLSLASHSDFLVVHALFSQDGSQKEGFLEVVRHVVPPFDLSRTLLVGGGFLVLCSLPGPPVSCKWLLWCLARVGGYSQCASSNILNLCIINLSSANHKVLSTVSI